MKKIDFIDLTLKHYSFFIFTRCEIHGKAKWFLL